jgi:hypothetical protein
MLSGDLVVMRYASVIVAACVVLAAGLIHGLRTDRWGAAQDLGAAAARLEETPMKLGDWEGKSVELDARQLAVAEAVGHLARRYVHRRTGDETTVVVLCGRPGPLSVHSPEVCYSGAGFELTGDRETLALPDGEGRPAGELFRGRFVKPGTPPEALDVLWAWKTSGVWAASANPRVDYARSAVLYKLYVIRRLSRPEEKPPQEPTLDFLRAFLPELEKHISPVS